MCGRSLTTGMRPLCLTEVISFAQGQLTTDAYRQNSFTARRVFDQETRYCSPAPQRPSINHHSNPTAYRRSKGWWHLTKQVLETSQQETPGSKIQFSQNPWHLLKLRIQRKSIQENSSWAWGELKLPHEKTLGFRIKS